MLSENIVFVFEFEGFNYDNLIFEELTVCEKNSQDTLIFKAPKDLIDCSIAQRRSINLNLLRRRYHGNMLLTGKIVFCLYGFVNEYFVSL